MHALVLFSIHQYTKFEILRFIHPKDMIGVQKILKPGHVTLTVPISGSLSLQG